MEPLPNTARAISGEHDHVEAAHKHLQELDKRIQDLTQSIQVLSSSIQQLHSSKVAELPRFIRQIKERHPIPEDCQTPQEVNTFLKRALHDARAESERLDKEKAEITERLEIRGRDDRKQLPDGKVESKKINSQEVVHHEPFFGEYPLEEDVLAHIVDLADPTIKATMAQLSRRWNQRVRTSLIKEYTRFVIRQLEAYIKALSQESMSTPKDIRDQVITELKRIEEDPFKGVRTLADIKTKILDLRGQMVEALSIVDPKDVALLPHTPRPSKLVPADFKYVVFSLVPDLLALPSVEDQAEELVDRYFESGNIEKALEMAKKVSRPDYHISSILKDIALQFSAAGDFDRAIALGEESPHCFLQVDILSDVASKLAAKGNIDRALEIANKIRESVQKDLAIIAVVVNGARAGKYKEVRAIANQIVDSTWKNEAFSKIASQFVATGKFREALTLANQITDSKLKKTILLEITLKLAAVGEYKEAFRVVVHLGDQQVSDACKKIFEGIPKETRVDDVFEGVKEMSFADSRSMNSNELVYTFLEVYSTDMIQQGRLQELLTFVEQLGYSSSKAKALCLIATGLVKVGKVDMALSLVMGIQDSYDRDRALLALATEIEKLRNYETWFSCVNHITKLEYRDEELKKYSTKCASRGEFQEAKRVAGCIRDEDQRLAAIGNIALEMAKNKMFPEAISQVNQITGRGQRERSLSQICLEMIKNGQITEAGDLVERMHDQESWSTVWGAISVETAKLGKFREAGALAERILYESPYSNRYPKIETLSQIAILVADKGDFDQAFEIMAKIPRSDARRDLLHSLVSKVKATTV